MISKADLEEDTIFAALAYLGDNDEHIRYAGARLLELIVTDHVPDARQYLRLLVEAAARRLDDVSPRVRMSAILSIAVLAGASTSQDFGDFRAAVDPLWARITDYRYIFGGEDKEARRAFLRVMNLCTDIGKAYPGIRAQVPEFLRQFWARSAMDRPGGYEILVEVMVGVARAVGLDAVVGMIGEELHGEGDRHASGVMYVVKKAVNVGIEEAVQDMVCLFPSKI